MTDEGVDTHINWETVKAFPTLNSALREIERMQLLGDMLVNAVHFLLDGAEPTEDLAGVLAAWEGSRND
jgi:hypothetical protein